MPELVGRDLSAFKRSDVNTADIAFKDKNREANRQQKIKQRSLNEEKSRAKQQPPAAPEVIGPKLAKKLKRRAEAAKRQEWDELADDFRLMKKFKKGRLSKKEFDDAFGV